MSEESKDPDVQVKLTIPQALADEIDRVMNGFYKYRQQYILEAVREKIKHDLAEKEVTA